ncbi:hypothetical protein ACS0TY_006362 [Phlomoides rotata]
MCMPKDWAGLGFRKMVWFNKALLAKQVWRMISEPETLLSRVYKAHYFKHGDIMDANLGSNPSYIWRSLCWSRELLRLGFWWRIGDGNSVRVGLDNWLLNSGSGGANFGPNPTIPVSAYILPSREWNKPKLRYDILSYEADEILGQSIGTEGESDSRFWKFSLKGLYAAKSGYEAYARLHLRGNVQEGSSN